MSLQLMLSYREVFDKMPNTIEDLTKDLPSKIVIYFLSLINSRIQRDSDEDVFRFVTRNWPESKINFILKAKLKYEESRSARVVFFSEWMVTEYIKYELINYRDFEFEYKDTTPLQEINLYLAYLLYVDVILDREKINDPDPNINYSFQELIWPLGIYQYEFIRFEPPIFDAIKIEIFLQELLKQEKYSPYVKAYMAKYNVTSTWALISLYVILMKWMHERMQTTDEFFLINSDENNQITNLLKQNVISIPEYQASEEKQKYFIGLKQKPIFIFKEGSYLILNWKFFMNQIYSGILFDFFFTSGVANIFNNNYGNFKSTSGYEIAEKILFRESIKLIFNNKKYNLTFPDSANVVDGYVRDNKYIYLIEFKDASVALSLVGSRSYDEFKDNIKRNFIINEHGKPKGITQLYNSINQLSSGPFDFDNFIVKGLKLKNIIVFPIIVYTDTYYSMYGVNDYLEKEFNQILDPSLIINVKPITMINLTFLLKHGESINKGRLKTIISAYHDWKRRIEKKLRKKPNMEESFKIFSPIEFSSQDDINKHENSYIDRVVNYFLDHLP